MIPQLQPIQNSLLQRREVCFNIFHNKPEEQKIVLPVPETIVFGSKVVGTGLLEVLNLLPDDYQVVRSNLKEISNFAL